MNVNERFNLGKFLKGFISIKFVVWVMATVALFMHLIDATWWGLISAGFMGINVAQDYIRRNGGYPGGGE